LTVRIACNRYPRNPIQPKFPVQQFNVKSETTENNMEPYLPTPQDNLPTKENPTTAQVHLPREAKEAPSLPRKSSYEEHLDREKERHAKLMEDLEDTRLYRRELSQHNETVRENMRLHTAAWEAHAKTVHTTNEEIARMTEAQGKTMIDLLTVMKEIRDQLAGVQSTLDSVHDVARQLR
jgi:hypothetical protein